MDTQKLQMEEAAILYYEKKLTQSEIARVMNLTRQTVSKLLSDAVKAQVVEITVHNAKTVRERLSQQLCERFGIRRAVVCGVSRDEETLCLLMTVKCAAEYLSPLFCEGNKKIALSWGRTVQMLCEEFPALAVPSDTVFPLFGATDQEEPYYLSNELARSLADRIGAAVKYAYFPYRPDTEEDAELFKKTSYYKKLCALWGDIDVAVVGIGNDKIIGNFGRIFEYNARCSLAVGDVATHFFDAQGGLLSLYENTLCASEQHLREAKETVAVASGKDKIAAIAGALRTGLIDTLITDEYTARGILALQEKGL